MINPVTFILMVIIGASPPQQRGQFQCHSRYIKIPGLGAMIAQGWMLSGVCLPQRAVLGN